MGLLHAARARMTGAGAASPEVVVERLGVCAGCSMRGPWRCKACGCILVAKAAVAAESCPLGLWEAE